MIDEMSELHNPIIMIVARSARIISPAAFSLSLALALCRLKGSLRFLSLLTSLSVNLIVVSSCTHSSFSNLTSPFYILISFTLCSASSFSPPFPSTTTRQLTCPSLCALLMSLPLIKLYAFRHRCLRCTAQTVIEC